MRSPNELVNGGRGRSMRRRRWRRTRMRRTRRTKKRRRRRGRRIFDHNVMLQGGATSGSNPPLLGVSSVLAHRSPCVFPLVPVSSDAQRCPITNTRLSISMIRYPALPEDQLGTLCPSTHNLYFISPSEKGSIILQLFSVLCVFGGSLDPVHFILYFTGNIHYR